MSISLVTAANVEEIRGKVLAGLATIDALAAAFQRSTRTIRRLELPYVKIGRTRLYDLEACRAAIMTAAIERTPPRPRGRPPKIGQPRKSACAR